MNSRCLIKRVTCRSGFWGSTAMFRSFPDLLRRFFLLPQQMWLLPSWSFLCMSLANRRGLTRSRTTRGESIQMGTWDGSTVYPILLSSTLLPFLTTWLPNLSTRRFLLSRSGPDILPIHCRSSAAWEPEWSRRWRARLRRRSRSQTTEEE